MRVRSFDVYQTDLPFRQVFRHAKHSRRSSASVFVRCLLEDGTSGFGEGLPRDYVTGENADAVFISLAEKVLPGLLDCDFDAFEEVESFSRGLYDWLGRPEMGLPGYHGALCCAVELALLDAWGKHFSRSFQTSDETSLRYSGVISSGTPLAVLALAMRYRLARSPAVKLKVGVPWDRANAPVARSILGGGVSLRADANGGWTVAEALEAIPRLMRNDIRHIEQPLPPGDLQGMRQLHEKTGAEIIVDEDLRDWTDAQQLTDTRACQGFNVRVSKCGGFFQSLRIAEEALRHGMIVQVGCQVGESALLSAAGLALARRLARVDFLEGFFGTYLLEHDVLTPDADGRCQALRFGSGGTPPVYPWQTGWGVPVDLRIIEMFSKKHVNVARG